MRVLVCGSRHFHDYELLEKKLDEYKITSIISGAARGADTLAGLYALRRGLDVVYFPAQWDKHGRAAGPIRNIQMLSEGKPDIVIGFLAPGSKGTKHMLDIARRAGIEVIEVAI